MKIVINRLSKFVELHWFVKKTSNTNNIQYAYRPTKLFFYFIVNFIT